MSRSDSVLAALFVFASAVVVAKLAALQFDRFFYAGASIAAVLLLVSRHRLGCIAAAFAWMGLRLLAAGVFGGKWWAIGLGALFAGIAYVAIRVAASGEEYDRISKAWRR